jgi:hypothetical protein
MARTHESSDHLINALACHAPPWIPNPRPLELWSRAEAVATDRIKVGEPDDVGRRNGQVETKRVRRAGGEVRVGCHDSCERERAGSVSGAQATAQLGSSPPWIGAAVAAREGNLGTEPGSRSRGPLVWGERPQRIE